MTHLILPFFVLTGCLSYSYRGLVDVDALPDNSLIGKTYEELLILYGMPDRITPLSQNTPVNKNPASLSKPRKIKSGDFIAAYNFISSYDILLYYRDRGYTYTFLIKNGIIDSLTSHMSNKTDGIGFRFGGGLGIITMGAAGGDMISPQ
jgi:hypothetical protein